MFFFSSLFFFASGRSLAYYLFKKKSKNNSSTNFDTSSAIRTQRTQPQAGIRRRSIVLHHQVIQNPRIIHRYHVNQDRLVLTGDRLVHPYGAKSFKVDRLTGQCSESRSEAFTSIVQLFPTLTLLLAAAWCYL